MITLEEIEVVVDVDKEKLRDVILDENLDWNEIEISEIRHPRSIMVEAANGTIVPAIALTANIIIPQKPTPGL